MPRIYYARTNKKREKESLISYVRVSLGIKMKELEKMSHVSMTDITQLDSGIKSPLYEKNLPRIDAKKIKKKPWIGRIAGLSRALNVSQSQILEEGLHRVAGQWRWQALLIGDALGTPPEDLFPRYFCAPHKTTLLKEQLHYLSLSSESALPEDRIFWRKKIIQVGKIFSQIPNEYKWFWVQYYIEGKTLVEISEEKDCSRTLVQQKIRKAERLFIQAWNAAEREKSFSNKNHTPELFHEIFDKIDEAFRV